MELQHLPQEVLEKVPLIQKFLAGEITAEETEVLNLWINESPENKALFESLTTKASQQELMQAFHRSKELTPVAKQRIIEDLFGSDTVVRPMHHLWRRAAVAAAVLFVVAAGIYLLYPKQHRKPEQPEAKVPPKQDAEPGKYKAMLTLADGSKVVLDSAATGKLAQQGGTQVLNKDGQLVYEQATGPSKEVLYNILSTARGQMYPVSLGDGSKVWLNSASSIRYPVSFTGNERRVTVTGEAYFEVAKNPAKPFIVTVEGMEVRVLGTHFNINAYRDDAQIQIKTTLVEGSVKITSASGKPTILQPGEQAAVSSAGAVAVVKDVNLEKEIAWKNALFIFDGDDVKTVMNQLARWYNIEVVYTGKIPDIKCYGIISMRRPVSNVLEVLQLSDIHLKIENAKIIVSQ